jgi:hypothetical protein
MRTRRALWIFRAPLLCFTVTAVLFAALATASTVDAAAGRTIYFRDGLGASARVTYSIVGKRVTFSGRLWDKPGDGYHARIYGHTNGRRFGIRKAVGGRPRGARFRGASPVRTHFEVCTYDRNVPLRCTTRWTTK